MICLQAFLLINYVECHDNATCFDKLMISNYDEDAKIQEKTRAKLLLAVCDIITRDSIYS